MNEEKRVVELDSHEHGLMVNGLNYFRKALEEEFLPTEDVEDLLLKVIDAPVKSGKRRQDREAR